eukprot:COSAG02_NODE_4422_length_5376_cov_220.147243_4_plen_58_part_00
MSIAQKHRLSNIDVGQKQSSETKHEPQEFLGASQSMQTKLTGLHRYLLRHFAAHHNL